MILNITNYSRHTQVKELYRSHEHILKPKRPSFSYPLKNANITDTSHIKQTIDSSDDDDDFFYDAPDHFSDDDDEQAPEDDVTNLIIKFRPLAVWNNSEENLVEYVLPPNFGK